MDSVTNNQEPKPTEGTEDLDFENLSGDLVADPSLDLDNPEYSKEYEEALKELRGEDEEESDEDGKPEPGKEDGKAESEKEEDKKPDTTAEAGVKASTKTLKARVGEGDLEIPLDAEIPVTVSGQQGTITIDELRRNYSSKQATKKEREEFLKERSSFERSKTLISNTVSEGIKQISEGKVAAGIAVFAEMAGKEPFEVVRAIRKSLIKDARRYLEIPEEEHEKLDKLDEAEYLRSKLEKKELSEKREREYLEFRDRVLKVVDDYGIEGVEEYNEYAQKAFDYVQQEKVAGRVPKDLTVTPETVGNFYLSQKTTEKVLAAVEEAAPDLLNNKEALQDLWKYAADNRCSKEALIAVILEARNQAPSSKDAKGDTTQTPKLESQEDLLAEFEEIDPGLDLDKTPQVSKLTKKKKR